MATLPNLRNFGDRDGALFGQRHHIDDLGQKRMRQVFVRLKMPNQLVRRAGRFQKLGPHHFDEQIGLWHFAALFRRFLKFDAACQKADPQGRLTALGEHVILLADHVAATNAKLDKLFARFRDRPLAELARDPEALKVGHNVFVNNCAACHGSDARGAKGFPNLTDSDWLYGGDPDTVLASVQNGRAGAMPALAAALPDGGVVQVANYVRSLSGLPHDPALAAQGKPRFETICAACHGPEGKGNPALGAPNLTDEVWLYGGTLATIEETITQGRNGKMPAWMNLLGADRTRLVAAWVLAQSADKSPAGGAP